MNTFTPKFIREQAQAIGEHVDKFNAQCNKMIIAIHDMEGVINDGKYLANDTVDFPSVGRELGSFEQSYISLQTAILNNFKNLITTMKKWADDTEEAEAIFSTKIRGLSENVDAINAMLALLAKA